MGKIFLSCGIFVKAYFFFLILLMFAQEGYAQNYDSIDSCLNLFNQIRRDIGLDTVTLSSDLSKACRDHAKYLVANNGNIKTDGLDAHNEYRDLKFFSEKGNQAGNNSIIANCKPMEAMRGFYRCFYHRIPIMQPNLRAIGIGTYSDSNSTYTVIDCFSNVDSGNSKIKIVCSPLRDQVNIPTSMIRNEIPNPVPDSLTDCLTLGFPIIIFFADDQLVRDVRFKLFNDKNEEINCFLSYPEKPAIDFPQCNSICAIPECRLNANTKYRVEVKFIVDRSVGSKIYSFTTVKFEEPEIYLK